MDKTKTPVQTERATKERKSRASDIKPVAKPATLEQVKDRVSVTDEALATIIGLAAHEVPGVVGMAPAGLREGIKRILGVAQADEGVEVTRADTQVATKATVDLHVVVAYGVNIPAVADSVKERVLYAAKTYAGVTLDKVCVHVAGVSRG